VKHGISDADARRVVRQRHEAIHTLTGYARYINIPGVPDEADPTDRITTVVETPLALHHMVILNALQLLVDNLLYYQPLTLGSPVDFGTVRGEPPMAHPGRTDGGVGNKNVQAPSLNSKNLRKLPSPVTDSGESNPHEHSLLHFADNKSTGNPRASTLENPDLASTEAGFNVRHCLHEVLSGNLRALDAMAIIADEMPGLVPCKRVMLMLPPGSAKSTYASVVFPTWQMGKIKAFETILTGWGDPICRRHGKRARQICASPQYQELFGTSLDPNTRSAEDWALKNASSYKSSGINSGVAGFRTHGLIWDDLTKNRKEADSEGIRTDIHNAYIDDARSRKTPSAWEVGIGTRWHEDEIMGRILPEGYNGESGFMRCRDGNVWYIICMAAECERDAQNDPLGRNKGEMIWPEWFDPEYWGEKRMNPRSWGSLYQQRPAPEEGIVFKKDKFKYYDVLPEGNNYISYDPGVSDTGDPTAMHRWRVDEEGRIYLKDSYYDQVSIDVWIVHLINWVRIWKPIECISESGVIRRAAEPFIMRAMRKAKAFFTQTWINRSANKPAMAAGAIAMVNSGQVFLPRNSDGERFLDACLKFPASKDDHEVDSFVNLCLRLEAIWDAAPIQDNKVKPVVIDGSISIKSLMPARFPKKRSRWAHGRKH
jgi:phage terminase large subunit-like protein